MNSTLDGKVALVAGATRGAGRGIAAALGEAGATVVCTGRSSAAGKAGSDYDRPETIEETVDLVTQLGGVGVAVQVDHLDAEQVAGLVVPELGTARCRMDFYDVGAVVWIYGSASGGYQTSPSRSTTASSPNSTGGMRSVEPFIAYSSRHVIDARRPTSR